MELRRELVDALEISEANMKHFVDELLTDAD